MPSPCPKGRRGALILIPLFFHPRSQAVIYLGEEEEEGEEERHTVNGNWPKKGGREGGMCVEDVPWTPDIICP